MSVLPVYLFLETACSVCDRGSVSMSQVSLISVAVTCLSFLHCRGLSSNDFGMCTVMVSAHCLIKNRLPFSLTRCLTEVRPFIPFHLATVFFVWSHLLLLWVIQWHLTSLLVILVFSFRNMWRALWTSDLQISLQQEKGKGLLPSSSRPFSLLTQQFPSRPVKHAGQNFIT